MKTKTCRGCNQNLSFEDFYVNYQMADNRLNHCKECVKTRVSKHRENNIERIQAYDRKRGLTEKRKEKNRIYSKTINGKEKMKMGNRKWKAKNPVKRAAHVILGNAIQSAKIKKQPCEVCGCTTRIHGHHDDHNFPLSVKWLCQKHHAQLHREERDLLRNL